MQFLEKSLVKFLRQQSVMTLYLQLALLKECAGHEAGCEVATNAMHTIFEDVKTEAVLLVDTANAIDSVNRQVFQHKI